MHKVCAHQARELKGALHGFLRRLGHAQDEESDESDSDLNAHSVFGDADKMPDSQDLLDPSEEQFDMPLTMPLIS